MSETAKQPVTDDPNHAALLERVVAARDKFGPALLLSNTDAEGNVQIPLAEIFIVQRIEKLKLKCLIEALEAGELTTDAVLRRFIVELEQATAELLKPKISLDVGRALNRRLK